MLSREDGQAVLDEHFELAGETTLDTRNRVGITKAVDQLRGLLGEDTVSRIHFVIYTNKVGQILLSPEVPVPAHEAWLVRNPAALAQVAEGLAQSARGEVRDLGSFAEFADVDIDHE